MTQTIAPWEQALWDELQNMTPEDQIVVSGEWITHITRSMLTKLAEHRRLTILRVLEDEHVDAGVLADRLGSRRTAIERLAAEARQLKRSNHEAQAAA